MIPYAFVCGLIGTKAYDLEGNYKVSGTKQYTTAIGKSTRTVFVIEPFDITPYLPESNSRQEEPFRMPSDVLGRLVKILKRPESSLTTWVWQRYRSPFSADEGAAVAENRGCVAEIPRPDAYHDRTVDSPMKCQIAMQRLDSSIAADHRAARDIELRLRRDRLRPRA